MDHSPYLEADTNRVHHHNKLTTVAASNVSISMHGKIQSSTTYDREDDSRQDSPPLDPKSMCNTTSGDTLSIRSEIPNASPFREYKNGTDGECSTYLSDASSTSALKDQWVLRRCDAWSENELECPSSISLSDSDDSIIDDDCILSIEEIQKLGPILAETPGRTGEVTLFWEDRIDGSIPLPIYY